MNYQKVYNNLMSSRMYLKKTRHSARKNGEYFEGHHIIPKSKGGTGCSTRGLNNDNIVYLTAREHFLAHWLLWRIYRDRASALSFHKMMSTNKNQNRIVSSRGYQEARFAFSETNKGNQYGKGQKKIISEEQKKRLSELMKGKRTGIENSFFGKKHSEETRKVISEKAKKRERPVSPILKSVFKNGIFIGLFEKSVEIANYIKTSHSNVRHVLGGSQKTANGYTIKYVNF